MAADDLRSYTDEALQAEVKRRHDARQAVEEERRRLTSVEVWCPACDGEGSQSYFNMEVAVGADDGRRVCSLCQGERHITARRYG